MSAFFSLLALAVTGLRCDESCGGEGWRENPDAWQWYVLALVALLPFFAGCWFVIAIHRREAARAAVLYVTGLAAVEAFFLARSGRLLFALPENGEAAFLLVVGVLAPVFALVFASSRVPRHGVTAPARPRR